jgi:hypothetical protein
MIALSFVPSLQVRRAQPERRLGDSRPLRTAPKAAVVMRVGARPGAPPRHPVVAVVSAGSQRHCASQLPPLAALSVGRAV